MYQTQQSIQSSVMQHRHIDLSLRLSSLLNAWLAQTSIELVFKKNTLECLIVLFPFFHATLCFTVMQHSSSHSLFYCSLMSKKDTQFSDQALHQSIRHGFLLSIGIKPDVYLVIQINKLTTCCSIMRCEHVGYVIFSQPQHMQR